MIDTSARTGPRQTIVTAVATPPAPPQLAFLADLSRALVRAARAWTLYPPSHPAATAPLDQLHAVIHDATALGPLRLSITPLTLLIGSASVERPIPQIAEAASFLHDRDILGLTFVSGPSRAELRALLQLLKLDIADVRTRGGPEAFWKAVACPSITIRQIDYRALFGNPSEPVGPARDDLWQSIVRTMRTRGTFGADAQRRLVEVAKDDDAMSALIDDVREPVRAADGSPLVSAQGLAVLHTYGRAATAVSVQAPDQLEQAIDVMAMVAGRLPPSVALEMVRTDEDLRLADGSSVQDRVVSAMGPPALGALLAEVVTRHGAGEHFDRVIRLITGDPARKTAVFAAARAELATRHGHQPRRLETLTDTLTQLQAGIKPTTHAPTIHERQLAAAGRRAQDMSLTGLPDELPAWLDTVEANNIRRLTVTLIGDLLRMEDQESRAGSLVDELRVIAEDLLLAGDYLGTLDVIRMLDSRLAGFGVGHRAARAALQQVATGAALQEAASLIGDMPADRFAAFRDTCRTLGPMAVEALRMALASPGVLSHRLTELIADQGAAGLERVAPLALDPRVAVQQKVAVLLGRIELAAGVPILERLLRSDHEAVVLESARALARLDDPDAARAFQAFLRNRTSDRRAAIIGVILDDLHPASVSSVAEILDRCKALGSEWRLALDLLAGLERLADARAVPVVARVMRQRQWFRPRRSRALKSAAIDVLVTIGSAGATAALQDATSTGDRMTRRLARAALHRAGREVSR